MKRPYRFSRPGLVATTSVLLAAATSPACAQGFTSQQFVAPSDEVFVMDLGGIVNRFDTKLRLDGQTSKGTDINFENNGMEKNLSSFEGSLAWRFLPNHRLRVQYFGAERSGSRNYATEIDLGDTQFPIGATVSAKAKDQFVDLDYRYSFSRRPDFEFTGIFGFYGGKFSYDVDAVGNGNTVTRTYHKSVSTTLPLPLIGIGGEWSPERRWKLAADFKGMKAKVGDVDGHAYIGTLSAEWMWMRGFGIGARYGYTDISADVSKSDFNGTLGWKSSSISLYGKFVF